jgi:uncharacterized SAM-binding protein YcdF (DUF218 family)
MSGSSLLRLIGLVSVVAFVLAAFTPLSNVLAARTQVHADLQDADAIVVLAASVDIKATLSATSLRRAVEGMVLYQKKLAPLLVFSGPANRTGIVEARVRTELARVLGIPVAAIITETTARTTREEAMRLAALLQPRGIRRILLVTDAAHMPRSLKLLRLRVMRQLAQELLARLYYRVAGYL